MTLRKLPLILFLWILCAFAAHAQTTTLSDVRGRQVRLELPAKRVALGFYFEDYLAISGEQGWGNVVGISRDAWKVWRPDSWRLYVARMPALARLADFGEVEAMSFSVEKLIELKPDVLVLADWQFQGLGSEVERIGAAGIPIVVVDYNAQKLESHLASTTLLGAIAGKPERARAINKDYRDAIAQIRQRLERADLPQPRVYAEFGNKGPAEYGFTYGKNMWGAMIEQAGGVNIAKPFVEWWGPINPEQILAARPDVVLISGTETSKNPSAMRMGQGVARKDAAARLAGYAMRAGWDSLPAVKGRRIYGVYQGASRTQADYTMVQYLAKVLYPGLFDDIDPERNYLEFYRKYLPVVPQGTFMTDLAALR
ncbi:ABC transporter substrate-binding protein [Herbaspirillum sp. LeCh32-8]|uniref:ABC transporter substrate-binding protein n=1 Tax=Herbaspirillum sp. LeCh32-8 TaxID=2821356 RepID=UPI001AE14A7E|nr:ABC transporter substrate-binding protein [Herbaspirillum sp. LeCh32-8]MBP0598078.1 ABC transporter substrate-binding protein [Herbaspirillum sp. LeCh32-8]